MRRLPLQSLCMKRQKDETHAILIKILYKKEQLHNNQSELRCTTVLFILLLAFLLLFRQESHHSVPCRIILSHK